MRAGIPTVAVVKRFTNAAIVDSSKSATAMFLLFIHPKALLADKGYDSNAVVELALATGMEAIIPSRSNRKLARALDSKRYLARHLVENLFQRMKICDCLA